VIVDPEQTLSQSSRASAVGFSSAINLQVVGTNGITTPVTTTPTTTTPPKNSAANLAAAKAAAKTAAAARTARLAAARAAAKNKPKPTTVHHTTGTILKHDLKVFPHDVSKFFKKVF